MYSINTSVCTDPNLTVTFVDVARTCAQLNCIYIYIYIYTYIRSIKGDDGGVDAYVT
jgi:hypothetical protein